MSFNARFLNANNVHPPFNTSNVKPLRNEFNDASYHVRSQNNFPNYINPPNINPYPLPTSSSFSTVNCIAETNLCDNNAITSRQSVNTLSLPHQPSINTARNLSSPVSQHINANLPFHQFHSNQPNVQFPNRNAVASINANCNNVNFNCDSSTANQCFPYPMPNVAYNTSPANVNYQRYPNNSSLGTPGNNILVNLPVPQQFSVTTSEISQNLINAPANYSVGNLSNPVPQSRPVIYGNTSTIGPIFNSPQLFSSKLPNECTAQLPHPTLQDDTSRPHNSNNILNTSLCDKERKVAEFLSKFFPNKHRNKHQVTIPEFRCAVKAVIYMIKLLNGRKSNLSALLNSNETEWKSEVESVLNEQNELSALCSYISTPDQLSSLLKKLKLIKKRRAGKKKTKENRLLEKVKAEQNRKEHDQEIDKWLDDIKEKNQKIKREAELKKEADFILLEVRRKIYEANKTIEKIKVFEKLRNARQTNSVKKGLHVLSIHNDKFEKKMAVLKETMVKQLADYEAEEKALKVMLETEQEGQREEEAQWKIKKMKTLQQKKQNHVIECLFGVSDDPLPTDPLYLFHKYHTSAKSSIENLIQIRHQWDLYTAENGEVVPQQWVVPVAPSNPDWEQCLITSKN